MKWLLLVVVLSGCVSPEMQRQRDEQIVMNWVRECEALGYVRKTDPWRECILKQRDYAFQVDRARMEAWQRSQPKSCYRDVLGTTCY